MARIKEKKMNDLISRQAAIDAIREMSPELFSAYQHNVYIDRQEALVRLMALPSTQQWIPCSEGSPEDGERVIVQYGDGSLGVIEHVRLKIWNLINSPYAKVVAWMPAPEPWRGEKDKNARI